MNNYLPERIYNRVKDIPDYQTIDNHINALKDCDNIVDFLISDEVIRTTCAEDWVKTGQIIEKYCPPSHYLQFKMMTMHGEQELLDALESTEDIETKLMAYQELYSLMQKPAFEQYMQEYLILYHTAIAEGVELSMKMHLEYFLFECYFYRKNMTVEVDMLGKFILFMDGLKAKIQDKCTLDTLNHLYVRQLAAFLGSAANLAGNDYLVVECLNQNILYIPQFKYDQYSYHVMELNDKMFDLYFSVRDFESARQIIQQNVSYINYALLNKKQLIKALNFYYYNYSKHFLGLVAKYRKIAELVPHLKLEFLNLDEKELAFTNYNINIIDAACQENEITFFRNDVIRDVAEKINNNVVSSVEGNAETYKIFNLWLEGKSIAEQILLKN
jgi:hypothetical protein